MVLVAEGSTENLGTLPLFWAQPPSEKQVVCVVPQRNPFFLPRDTQEVNLSRPGSGRRARLPQPSCPAPLSAPASPECFGEPPHYRINAGQTYYTHSRAHSSCLASPRICPIGTGGQNHDPHPVRTWRKLSGAPLENHSCTVVYSL